MAEPHGVDQKAKMLASTPRKGRRSVPWRRDLEILARLELVSAMLLRGATVRQIAETLDCSISTAKRDKKRVEKLWLESAQEAVADNRARSIAQFREVQTRAWAQYDDKSSPRYLRIVVECEKEVVGLQGTRKPIEARLSGADGGPISVKPVFDLSGMDEDGLDKLLDNLKAALCSGAPGEVPAGGTEAGPGGARSADVDDRAPADAGAGEAV